MSETRVLHFEQFVKAPPEEALRAFTHPTALRDWLCQAALSEARVGGGISLHWHDGTFTSGTFKRINSPAGLAFSWNGYRDPGESLVTVSCAAQDGGTLVTLDHQVGSGAEWDKTAQGLSKHWPEMLENMQSLVETGIDLRQARRPRLGIIYDEFNAEKAAQLGTPVNEGVLLHGTAENSGAQAAGLLKDDVLVSLNGVPLRDPNSFDVALAGLKAGDRPAVEYYRGAQKVTVPLELGSFPTAELPASPAELVAQVRETFKRVSGEMSALLAGLSDEQAGRRPSEKEWSPKQMVAHFILCDRDIQSWVANMIMDNEVPNSLQFQPNVDERLDALVARLGSLDALMGEMALANGETCALLAALPEKFTHQRKHLYRRVAEWMLEVFPSHFDDEHGDQFKRTVEAVKGSIAV